MGMESIYKLSVLVNMIDRISGPTATIQRAVGNTASTFQDYSHNMARMATDGAVLIGTGQQITNAAIAPVKATFGTQDALAELASLGVQDLGKLEGAARDFSRTWAGTTKAEFLTAAYDIKSGIASLSDQGVADMTRIAAITAKATKSTEAEMTSLFATGYGIYKDYYGNLSDLEFGEMFSGGIAKSVQQFKTTGSGMAQAISALGGTATAAAVPLEEQLAILGMLQATMSGSEAGTKYTAFLQNAARAGQELGLNFSDTNGQLLAMPQILGQIRGKFGDVMTVTDKMELQKAFGTVEAVKLIDLLYGKTDDLQGNIVTLYDTMGKGMSITADMANKINAPPGQSWKTFTQTVQGSMEDIGNAMLPTFVKMQASADKLIQKFAEFTRKNPELVSSLMYILMAIGGLMMGMGGLKLLIGGLCTFAAVFGKIKVAWSLLKDGILTARIAMMLLGDKLSPLKSGLLSLLGSIKSNTLGFIAWAKQGILSAAAALPGLIASVWGFAAAAWAAVVPMLPWIIGIGLVIAALVLLWKNWDSVSAWISNTWNAVCAGVSSGIEWLKNGIGSIINWIGEKLAAFKNLGASILTGITDGIVSVASKPIEAVKGVFTKIREMLPFSDAKTGPLSDLTLSGQRVFTTFNAGMQQTAGMLSQTMEGAFGKVNKQLSSSPFVPVIRPENTAINTGKQIVDSVPQQATESAFGKVNKQLASSPFAPIIRPENTAINAGKQIVDSVPQQATESAFGKVNQQMTGSAFAPITRPENTAKEADKGKTTIIQKLVLYVKPEDIKSIQAIKQLLDEMTDLENSSGADPVPEV